MWLWINEVSLKYKSQS